MLRAEWPPRLKPKPRPQVMYGHPAGQTPPPQSWACFTGLWSAGIATVFTGITTNMHDTNLSFCANTGHPHPPAFTKEQFSDEGPSNSFTFGLQIPHIHTCDTGTPCKGHPCPWDSTALAEGIDTGLRGSGQQAKAGSKPSPFLLNMQSFDATQSWSGSPPSAPPLRKQVNSYSTKHLGK